MYSAPRQLPALPCTEIYPVIRFLRRFANTHYEYFNIYIYIIKYTLSIRILGEKFEDPYVGKERDRNRGREGGSGGGVGLRTDSTRTNI